MIDISIFTSDYIQTLSKEIKADCNLVERALFAFGLLETLTTVHLPFIFKGGTCLLLLLDEPRRLSTDIDIIVNENIDIDFYLNEAEKIFPFKYMQENIRKKRSNIQKRHFRFFYESPLQPQCANIILDVVFEESPYTKVIKKEIKNVFLKTKSPYSYVLVPTINCILGDKLTAFAPHTIGILFNLNKEMEVIKQLNDIASLFDKMNDFKEVKNTYIKTANLEIAFRKLNITYMKCLEDTICSCICIMAKNSIMQNEYASFLIGIRKIKGHMLGYQYNPDVAVEQAAKTLYLCACILANRDFKYITVFNRYNDIKKLPNSLKSLFYLKKFNAQAFTYLCETMKLIDLELLLKK